MWLRRRRATARVECSGIMGTTSTILCIQRLPVGWNQRESCADPIRSHGRWLSAVQGDPVLWRSRDVAISCCGDPVVCRSRVVMGDGPRCASQLSASVFHVSDSVGSTESTSDTIWHEMNHDRSKWIHAESRIQYGAQIQSVAVCVSTVVVSHTHTHRMQLTEVSVR